MEHPTDKTSSSTDERDLIVSMRKLDLIKELGFVFWNFVQIEIYHFSFPEKNKLNYNVYNLI